MTFKYLKNRKPADAYNGIFSSEADSYLGVENLQQFQTARSFETGAPSGSAASGYGGHVSSTVAFTNDLTDLSVNDLGNGWWEVSEVYMTQPHVTSTVS